MEGELILDEEKAIYHYDIAAKLGHMRSQVILGNLYYYGFSVNKDINLSYKYFLAAASNGNASSMYRVASIIINKEIPDLDYSEGYEWLKKAIIFGDEDAKELLVKVNNDKKIE